MFSFSTKWIEQEIPYTGAELRSHFIYDHCNLLGDALIAFAGPCKVGLKQMVDLEDVKQNRPIYSEKMLHFLIEHFGIEMNRLVLLQRLLVVSIFEELLKRGIGTQLRRTGDDLFDGNSKLTVSIATLTPISGVIHTGINISSKNTPVPTKGLNDYKIEAADFAQSVLKAYASEVESVWKATCKVRGVP
jgi:hypothetical protein